MGEERRDASVMRYARELCLSPSLCAAAASPQPQCAQRRALRAAPRMSRQLRSAAAEELALAVHAMRPCIHALTRSDRGLCRLTLLAVTLDSDAARSTSAAHAPAALSHGRTTRAGRRGHESRGRRCSHSGRRRCIFVLLFLLRAAAEAAGREEGERGGGGEQRRRRGRRSRAG